MLRIHSEGKKFHIIQRLKIFCNRSHVLIHLRTNRRTCGKEKTCYIYFPFNIFIRNYFSILVDEGERRNRMINGVAFFIYIFRTKKFKMLIMIPSCYQENPK